MNYRVASYFVAGFFLATGLLFTVQAEAQFDVIAQYNFENGDDFLVDSVGGHDLEQSSSSAANVVWAVGPGGVGDAAYFNAWASLATVDPLDLSSYRHLRISWSMNEPAGQPGTRFVFDHNWTQTTGPGAGMAMAVGASQMAGMDTLAGDYACDSFAYAGADTWVDFAVELDLDGLTHADQVKIYMDGNLVGTPFYTDAPPLAFSANALFSLGGYDGQAIGPNKLGGYIANMTIESFSVPEPGTIMLLATSLIGLLCCSWRKRK